MASVRHHSPYGGQRLFALDLALDQTVQAGTVNRRKEAAVVGLEEVRCLGAAQKCLNMPHAGMRAHAFAASEGVWQQ